MVATTLSAASAVEMEIKMEFGRGGLQEAQMSLPEIGAQFAPAKINMHCNNKGAQWLSFTPAVFDGRFKDYTFYDANNAAHEFNADKRLSDQQSDRFMKLLTENSIIYMVSNADNSKEYKFDTVGLVETLRVLVPVCKKMAGAE